MKKTPSTLSRIAVAAAYVLFALFAVLALSACVGGGGMNAHGENRDAAITAVAGGGFLPPPVWSTPRIAPDAECKYSRGQGAASALPVHDPENDRLGPGVAVGIIGGGIDAGDIELTSNAEAGANFAGAPVAAPIHLRGARTPR